MAVQNVKEKKIILLIFLIGIFIYGVYEFFEQRNIESNGVYTKAIVLNSEGYKGGRMITVDYNYGGKQYEASIVADLGKSAIGCQYFIQFKSHDPKNFVFHKDEPVPDCLTNVEAPKHGWDKIPSCP